MTDEELKAMMHKYQAEQREDEVIWFYRHVEKIQPKVIVELGNKEGGNLKLLSTHLSEDGLLIGVDQRRAIVWQGDDCICKYKYISGDTHIKTTKGKLLNLLKGRPIDVLFIDGDHSYEGMLEDYKDYAPLVRSGGIIAIHDIYYLEDVAEAWLNIPDEGKRHETPYNQSSIGIGILIKD